MIVGLRIDVDTMRGTREGVPELCRVLAERDLSASFFFSVGPDNMGRHLWRLLRPAFLRKMLRSNGPSLYGWDILLRGTFWPGPIISERAADSIRAAHEAGHELGFHAWDHHLWQMHIDDLDEPQVAEITERGVRALERATGHLPTCSAAPGWRCNDVVLRAQQAFPFAYQSDCRGESIFLPFVDGVAHPRPQIPVTLPTYDEVIGRDGVTDTNYNAGLLARLNPERLNVLAIHAEVEGGSRSELFVEFLDEAIARGWRFVPLGDLLASGVELPVAPIVAEQLPGREGWVAQQGQTSFHTAMRPGRVRGPRSLQ